MIKSKLVRLSRKGQFVIPKEMRDSLGVMDGDCLLVTQEGNRLVLVKPEQYARLTRGALKGTWGNKESIDDYLQQERNTWD